MDQAALQLLQAKVVRTTSNINVYNWSKEVTKDLVELDNRLKAQESRLSGGGTYVGILDFHKDLGYPIDGRPLSNVLYSDMKSGRIPKNVVLQLGPYQNYKFNAHLEVRLDLGWQGVPNGVVGNFNKSSDMGGSVIRPEVDGVPVFDISPPLLSQVGPTIQWLQGYCGDFQTYATDFIRVNNCNNTVIKHVGNIYGKSVIHTIGVDDDAWHHLEDIRSVWCTNGIDYDASLGWTCFGIIGYTRKGQALIRERNFAQNNKTYGIRCDAHIENDTNTFEGVAVVCETGAHNNDHDIAKIEACNPAIVLTSTAPGSPTRANKFTGGVIGGQETTNKAFVIGQNVEFTYIGPDISYTNSLLTNEQLIEDHGKYTKKPLPADMIRG